MDPTRGEDEDRTLGTRLSFLARLVTSGLRSFPAFLLIGGMKCGTTSLYQYLARHPGVERGSKEEVHYFDLNYHRSLLWYRAHFPYRGRGGEGPIAGDDTPYYLFHPLVPERVARDLPDVRLVVLLRDPVARAYSHYSHEHRRGREQLPFEQALAREEGRLEGEEERMRENALHVSWEHMRYSYMSRGRYAEQLARWFHHIPRERFLVMQSEEMFRDPAPVVDRTLEFLNLPPMGPIEYEVHNPGSYEPMSEAAREMLEEHFQPLNEELFSLLGERFDW